MGPLLLGGHPEAGVLDAHRIAGAHDVLDDAALARGVHALQHQQQRSVVFAGLAVGVEHLLQAGEAFVALGLHVGRPVLVAGVAGTRVGVEVGDFLAGAKREDLAGCVGPLSRQVGHSREA